MVGITKSKREAEEGFHEALAKEGKISPENLMIAVMNGESSIVVDGKTRKITKTMIEAAQQLIPYRLPKLNSIDAVQRNVEMTHEDWINELEQDAQAETEGK